MKKLIVCDFDGTLYKKENIRAFENVLKIIKNADKNNVFFAVASGRPLFLLKDYFKSVYDNIFVISCDGALITKSDKVLYSRPIDKKTVDNAAKKSDYGFAACAKLLAYIKYSEKTVGKQLFEQLGGHVLPAEDRGGNEEIYKMFFLENPRKNQNETEKFKDFGGCLKTTYMKNSIFEFSSPCADKADAAAFLLNRLGINRENVFVFGNGANDVQMFKAFENSYADISSPPGVKKEAAYIFKDIEKEIEKIIAL